MTKQAEARQGTAAKKIRTVKSRKSGIVTVLRVKNEEQYIHGALKSLFPLNGEIVVLDDGSTDTTPDIVRGFSDVHYHRQDDVPMDEGRDRTFLYREALKLKPQWIFTLDGDEELDETGAGRLLRATEKCPDDVNVFVMFMAVMASKPAALKPKRYSGASPLGFWSMTRAFRVRDADRTYEFVSNFGNNLHCGCVPEMKNIKIQKLNAWIRYYGYEDEAAIALKREFYKMHDPANFDKVKRMWAERAKQKTVGWPAVPDCREMGITGTVTY